MTTKAGLIEGESEKIDFNVADLQLTFPMEMPATRSQGKGKWKLIEPWVFNLNQHRFTVPEGFITDLYSVPWGISLFFPRDEKDNRAGLIHDYFYATAGLRATANDKQLDREIGDRLLLIACLQCAFRVSRAMSIHAGVRAGGWYQFGKLTKAGYSIEHPMMD